MTTSYFLLHNHPYLPSLQLFIFNFTMGRYRENRYELHGQSTHIDQTSTIQQIQPIPDYLSSGINRMTDCGGKILILPRPEQNSSPQAVYQSGFKRHTPLLSTFHPKNSSLPRIIHLDSSSPENRPQTQNALCIPTPDAKAVAQPKIIQASPPKKCLTAV